MMSCVSECALPNKRVIMLSGLATERDVRNGWDKNNGVTMLGACNHDNNEQ